MLNKINKKAKFCLFQIYLFFLSFSFFKSICNRMDGSETQISYQTDSQTAPSTMANVDTQRPLYTVPGILHFLQHEWTRFEIERQQWETERAEFQVKKQKIIF